MGNDDINELSAKQKKKEEGKRRAREIAIARKPKPSGVTIGSTRHGARNQHRHKHFVKWILSRFPHILNECFDDGANTETENILHILDIAGGKGELSSRLCLCHSLRVKMVDPRQADIASVYMKDVIPKLPNKWQDSLHNRLKSDPSFVNNLLKRRFEQLVIPFDTPNYGNCVEMTESDRKDWFQSKMSPVLHDAVQNSTLIIGLHADGATEAVVDAALFYNKPFVVVPCCVFPNLFNNRVVTVEDGDDDGGTTKQIPVRTHEQFCDYLLQKNVRFKREILPFKGRNIAIWWDGKG